MDTHKYLIIGGSTKCGTTSVFNYFEYHPRVCPCVMKESRYFWTGDYPLSETSGQHEKIKSFSALFKNCRNNQVRIEATPDYLYSYDSAVRIHKELPECKMVFLLRHPVTRLVSWYNFAKLNGFIPQSTSFATYVDLQQKQSPINKPQYLRALEQGLYAGYVEQYIRLMKPGNVLVVFYEDLVADPGKVCADIARFAGIDEDYFVNYDFRIFNKTVSAKSVGAHQLFRKLKRTVRPVTRLFHASIRKKLKLAGHKLETTYQSANKKAETSEVVIPAELQLYLEAFYKEDQIKLQQVTGKRLPW